MEARYVIAGVFLIAAIMWIIYWVPKMRQLKRRTDEKQRTMQIEFGSMQALRLIRQLTDAATPQARSVYLVLMRRQYIEREHSVELQDKVWIETVEKYLASAVERSPDMGPKLRDFVQLGLTP